MIRLYDTARRSVVPLELRDPGKVSIYVCGPTVYAPPHLGHGRMALSYDILRRYLVFRGYDVEFVSNITDIEDKIIQRAAEEGRPWQEVTAEFRAGLPVTHGAHQRPPPRSHPHATGTSWTDGAAHRH
ncbi:MAG: class I tRNA ligase family protein [Acidimicrobiales bacterium]